MPHTLTSIADPAPRIATVAGTVDRTGADHIGSIIDAVSGAEIAHFAWRSGGRFSLPIGIPLCDGCDGALDDEGYCASCETGAKPHWRDTIAAVRPRCLSAVRSALLPPEELTEALYTMTRGN